MFVYSLSFPDPTFTPEEIRDFLERELNAEEIETLPGESETSGFLIRFRHLWIEPATVAAQIERRFDLRGVEVQRSGEGGVSVVEAPVEADLEDEASALNRRVLDLIREAESMSPEELRRVLTRRSASDIRAAVRNLEQIGAICHIGGGRYAMAPADRSQPPQMFLAPPPPPKRKGDHFPPNSLAARIRDLLETVPILTRDRIAAVAQEDDEEIRAALLRLGKNRIMRRTKRDLYVKMGRPDPTRDELVALGLLATPKGPEATEGDPALARIRAALAGGTIASAKHLEVLFPKPEVLVRRALAQLLRDGQVRKVGPNLYMAADRPEPTAEELRAVRKRGPKVPAAPAPGSAADLVLKGLEGGRILRVADLVASDPGKTPAAFSLALKKLLVAQLIRRVGSGLYVSAGQPDPSPDTLEVLLAKLKRKKALSRQRRKAQVPAALRPRGGLPGAILARSEDGTPINADVAVTLMPGATRGAAYQALRVLEKAGLLRRLSKGVYVSPTAAPPPATDGPVDRPDRDDAPVAEPQPVRPPAAEPERSEPGGTEAAPARRARAAGPGAKPGTISHALLERIRTGGPLRLDEAFRLLPEIHPPSVKTALSSLTKSGVVRRAGKGLYEIGHLPESEPPIVPLPNATPATSLSSGVDPQPEGPLAVDLGTPIDRSLAELLQAIDIDGYTAEEIEARLSAPLGQGQHIGRLLAEMEDGGLVLQRVKPNSGEPPRVEWSMTGYGLEHYARPSTPDVASASQGDAARTPEAAAGTPASEPRKAISTSQAILQVLAGGETLAVAEIRARIPQLQGARSPASALLSNLEKRGLVRRTRTALLRDSRFALTEKGRQILVGATSDALDE